MSICKARKKPDREAYISYVERRGLRHNAAGGRFSTALFLLTVFLFSIN
jgi:hypothetical protein